MNHQTPMSLLWDERRPDETQTLVQEVLDELEKALEKRPSAPVDIPHIIEVSLAPPLDGDSWFRLSENLKTYLGSDAGDLLSWVANQDVPETLDGLQEAGCDRALVLMRKVIATFGRQIVRSIGYSNGWVDDWERIFTAVMYDEASSLYRLRARIRKVNGKHIVIEGSPDSFMTMTEYLLDMLRAIGSPEFFSEEGRRRFVAHAEDVLNLLREIPTVEDAHERKGSAATNP